MKKIIITFIIFIFSISVFAFNLNTISGIQNSIQRWYKLTTGKNMSINNIKCITNSIIISSKRFNISIPTIMGVIAVESSFIPTATNGVSVGLMQVQPNTLKFVRRYFHIPNGDLNNIKYSITIGTAYLSYLKSLNLTRQEMIEDYNGGPNKAHYYIMVENAISKMISWK